MMMKIKDKPLFLPQDINLKANIKIYKIHRKYQQNWVHKILFKNYCQLKRKISIC